MARCAFAIIRNKDDKILLVQISPPFAEAYKWNFPGGVIENGESIRNGLVREVNEETSISCSVIKKRDRFVTSDALDEINIYDAMYKSGVISIQEEELVDAEWYTTEQALRLPLAFNIRHYISQLEF